MAELGWTHPSFLSDNDGSIILEHCVTRYHAYDVRESTFLLPYSSCVQLSEPYRWFTRVLLRPDTRH